jgi:mannose-6-phosphate isomerase-like protein (cupin superfamily)
MIDHTTVIVQKPWGYEYLAYQNADVALWLLYISPNEKTSMHCHPTKSTGLVVLNGSAEINFIADSKILKAPAKQMIRRGLFHQTHAIGDDGVVMFEIETPVDKDDLVRLHDKYGRTNDGYEGKQFELPKNEDCLWITDPVDQEKYTIESCTLLVKRIGNISSFDTIESDDIIIFLQGGVVKTINGRTHRAIIPGDVGQAKVVQQVVKEMDGVEDNTIIMIVQNENQSQ